MHLSKAVFNVLMVNEKMKTSDGTNQLAQAWSVNFLGCIIAEGQEEIPSEHPKMSASAQELLTAARQQGLTAARNSLTTGRRNRAAQRSFWNQSLNGKKSYQPKVKITGWK